MTKMTLIRSKWRSKWPTAKFYNSLLKTYKWRKQTIISWFNIVLYHIQGVLSLAMEKSEIEPDH